MKTVVDPEEDRKLSPSSSSKNESSSDFEPESESEPEKKPKKKIVKLVSKQLRVKRNTEHGLHKPSKKPKKRDLWEYTEQTLCHDLVVQVLPSPQESFVFRKAMTMKEVPTTPSVDNTLLTVLSKFSTPLCNTTKLSDIQTEYLGFEMFRRVVVRKRMSAGKYTYAVMPNMVISSKKKVYHRTNGGVWYEKTTTNNRAKEMAIPVRVPGLPPKKF